jgi:hypothetical protein
MERFGRPSERTFPKFCVSDNNTSDLSNMWCDVGHWYILYIDDDPLKLKSKRENDYLAILQDLSGQIIRVSSGQIF